MCFTWRTLDPARRTDREAKAWRGNVSATAARYLPLGNVNFERRAESAELCNLKSEPRTQEEASMSVTLANSVNIEGFVSSGFEAVRDVFADNFEHRHELGGACCAYYRGEKVVDLWGGIRNKQTGDPWEQDTIVLVYSATKGLAAMTLALAHSRGWL